MMENLITKNDEKDEKIQLDKFDDINSPKFRKRRNAIVLSEEEQNSLLQKILNN